MMKKIIKTIYVMIVMISLFVFFLYATYTLEQNTYYVAQDLSQTESDEIKDLIGLSQFTNLTIYSYSHKLVYGDDAIAQYIFDLVIPNNEYDTFIEYINAEMNGQSLNMKPCIKICEDNIDIAQSAHSMQIAYVGQEGSEGDIRIYVTSNKHDIHYSDKISQLLSQFAALFISYLIVYFVVFKILFRR